MSKKRILIVISICLVLIIALGSTYSYWTTTKIQEDDNTVGTTCLSIDFRDTEVGNTGIKLLKAFPITDEEGKNTKGYQFTITNRCDTYVEYSVNLESLILENNNANRINLANINAILDDNSVKAITSYNEAEQQVLDSTIADDARVLTTGVLKPAGQTGYTVNYTLRLWLDEDTPETEMNKSYKSKITIIAKNREQPKTATMIISALQSTKPEQFRTDVDGNLRFIGSDPDNYVTFSGELWRIIGVFNDVEGETTSAAGEPRLKISLSSSLSGQYWSNIKTTGYNYNNWEYATVNKYLNVEYYESLSDKNMIDTATYYLGGYSHNDTNSEYYYQIMKPEDWYNAERITTNVNGNNPGTWTGNVGLMYPSDFGYAASDCQDTAIYSWSTSCRDVDWLDKPINNQWTITPAFSTTNTSLYILNNGKVRDAYSRLSSYGIRPVLYLDSAVEIDGGEGTSDLPYTLK